ncbi:hypothetical protein M431DRAFT_511311 [Trichoderma harzianum CBS 226.95]|uniref:Uncharacterized protein n=1 Tax=Trichoderma harzianum CBS 226.95 TaxID=983964 RepID=A0A2T4A2A6_TRIHA|nr:hypothetical protein M431DRAFT_511311 [Trichoderma harzianum CBS 226.95]PTB51201.1 hypothetical protein M431DRAFT_511311 [Trichoderma harzianum CBS 226.95]
MDIPLPDIQSLMEKGHRHSRTNNASICSKVFDRFIELASNSTSVIWSRYKSTTFGSVDLETRTYSKAISSEALNAIVGLERVKKYMNRGILGKRPIYIITGLRIARESFSVAYEARSRIETSFAVLGSAATGPLPLNIGASISEKNDKSRKDEYQIAASVVFAYRLHVIRERRSGDVETELFRHRTAFMTGERDDEGKSIKEMVVEEVNTEVLREDLGIEPDFEEFAVAEEAQDELCILFQKSDSKA